MKAARLLREPLLHFLLFGAALFGVWLWRRDAAGSDSARIVVTRARIEQLATGFSRTWQRPPAPQELEGLVRDFVREEVCVREATAMGLDRDDTIIRRRLRQKFEFLTEDALETAAPTDADLTAFLSAHPDSFRVEPRIEGSANRLDAVRDAVTREWETAQRKERSEALFRKLLARYEVVIEPPGGPAPKGSAPRDRKTP